MLPKTNGSSFATKENIDSEIEMLHQDQWQLSCHRTEHSFSAIEMLHQDQWQLSCHRREHSFQQLKCYTKTNGRSAATESIKLHLFCFFSMCIIAEHQCVRYCRASVCALLQSISVCVIAEHQCVRYCRASVCALLQSISVCVIAELFSFKFFKVSVKCIWFSNGQLHRHTDEAMLKIIFCI